MTELISSKTKLDADAAISAAAELMGRIEEFLGLYLDAIQGFDQNVKFLKRGQEEAVKKGIQTEFPDDAKIYFGKGSPNDPKNVLLHTTTLGEYKRRNSEGGSNYMLLGQYFVVLVFHLWDGEYRLRIANALGLSDSDELKLPICGDLRLLRNDILKHRGVITTEKQSRLQVLKSIPANQSLMLSKDQIEEIVKFLQRATDDLIATHTGIDPKHRTIWHLK